MGGGAEKEDRGGGGAGGGHNFCVSVAFTDPEFVNVQGAQESIPPAYLAWRAGTITPFVVPACQESISGLLKSLQIRAQGIKVIYV
jgi:hypothetical protein